MPILNYTTAVPAERTAAEIVGKLAVKGARRVNHEYGDGGVLVGIGFTYEVGGFPVYFKLPANTEGVEKYMLAEAQKKNRGMGLPQAKRDAIKEQARRTAWRILKDWIEAQIALVDSQQAAMAQVFLPYAQDERGRSTYEIFLAHNEQRALGSGSTE